MIADAVSIYKKSEDEYIIKNSESGQYIKAGEKEVSFFLSLDKENKYDDLEIDKSSIEKLNEEEKQYLLDYFKKTSFWNDNESDELITNNKKSIKEYLKNIAVIRLINLNPDKWLTKTKSFFDVFFSLPAVILIITLVVAGESMLLSQAELLNYAELLHVDAVSIMLLVVSVLPTGVIHECAHSIACKHYGGEVKKMGFLLFYFMPAFYADVSDIYLIKRRKHRMIVCLAGVISNLIIGNISLIAFSVFNAHNIMVKFLFYYYIFNLGTAVYNLFPFVKMDGYWILQTLFNESNLMDKAKTMLFMLMFKHNTYRNIFEKNRNKKRLYLICGIIMSFFSIVFWYIGVVTIYELLLANLGMNIANTVCCLLTTMIVASLVLEVRMYHRMARDNKFSWR